MDRDFHLSCWSRDRETAVRRTAQNVVKAWMRLGECEDEFMPDYPDACAEHADHLDTCISELSEALNPGENERLVKLGMEVFNQVLEDKRATRTGQDAASPPSGSSRED